MNKQNIQYSSIKDVLPEIFKRSYVFVAPEIRVEPTALLLLPVMQLFFDGIVVVKDKQPVGRIGSYSFLRDALEKGIKSCFLRVAEDIMSSLAQPATEKTDVKTFLDIFKETRFGFYPIVDEKNHLIAVNSIRDYLRLVEKMDMNIPVSSVSSKLIFVSEGISLENALRIMIKKGIRKLAIEGSGNKIDIVDDRIILNYICYNSTNPHLFDVSIDRLPTETIISLSPDTSISKAAELLSARNPACSVLEHSIVTPWDIVMKTLS